MAGVVNSGVDFMNVIAVDYETFFSSKLKYSVRTMLPAQYCAHELFDSYMISACDGKSAWAGSVKDFNWEALHGQHLVAHNSAFDSAVFREMQKRGWIPAHIKPAKWSCTANMTAYLCNRRALDNAVEHLYKVKLDKSVRSDANNKHWPQDFSAEEQAAMVKYARSDAVWCRRLWADFYDRWPEKEQRLAEMTTRQGEHGVQIDAELLEKQLLLAFDMKAATQKLLPWLDDAWDEADEFEARPTSLKCIAEACRRAGIPCPPVKAHTSEEEYAAWEATYSPKNLWIPALSSWRSINKLYKTLLTVKERLRTDGTLPFSLRYFGAATGRWSGEAGINFQNFRKVPLFANENMLMETDEKRIQAAVSAHGETGQWPGWVKGDIDFRALIIPRPGHRMIVSDLAAIEPRVLAWLTGDTAMLEMIKGGVNVYEAHARSTMGWTGGKLKSENPSVYQLAKIRVLGLGYGAGWEKLLVIAQSMGLDLTKDDPEFVDELDRITGEIKQVSGYGATAKQTVKDFRAQNTKLTALWAQLDAGFKSSVGGVFTLTLPNGRKLTYNDVRAQVRVQKNAKTGLPERRWEFAADADGRHKGYYGSKILENLVQSTARDVFAEHLIALESSGITPLWSVHDEAVVEVPLDSSVRACDIEHIMSQTPEWIPGLPVAAEAKEVERYCK